jgi:hypothetical protein
MKISIKIKNQASKENLHHQRQLLFPSASKENFLLLNKKMEKGKKGAKKWRWRCLQLVGGSTPSSSSKNNLTIFRE